MHHKMIKQKMWKKCTAGKNFFMKQSAPQETYKQNAPQARFSDWILIDGLSYWYSM